jgi:FKBP-type peptidyl-prolyl cis-trans isomerase FkpA
MTEDEKALYALGAAIGQQASQAVKPLDLSPAEMEVVKKGLAASLAGEKPEYTLEQYGPKLQARANANASKAAVGEKQKSAAFRESAAAEPGAVKTTSGLVYRTLKPGRGPSPKAADTVRVHYQGALTDGTVFDSSRQRGQPVEFALNAVIPCWTEGVQRMKVGESAKLVCPSDIAYGDQGRPPTIPGGATLVFEVELLGIKGR